jgi:hypothetical protein
MLLEAESESRTEQQLVEVWLPEHPDKLKYEVERIEVRLSDGLMKFLAGPPTIGCMK